MNSQHDNSPGSGLRKAAVLVGVLDHASADAMLEQLDPEQARRVRRLAVELGPIDPKEQRTVIDEFFRVGAMAPKKQPAGIELDGRLARQPAASTAGSAEDTPPAALPPDPQPFRFLHEAEADKLIRVLQQERPQTIALVLAHLPPDQAGSVLARIPGALQAEVIHRLVDLEETNPEILREVERALESRLSQQVRMQRRRVAGMKALAGILEASDGRTGMQILDNLAVHDRALAERLLPQTLSFDDLVRLDDAALGDLFQAVQPELAMTALVGAPPELIDRILRRLSPAEARTVRQRLDHPGPIRLSDVEDAREQIAEVARRLSMGRSRLAPRDEAHLAQRDAYHEAHLAERDGYHTRDAYDKNVT